jgi:ribosomal-protein-alanine N-acetyltransferase
MTVPKDYSVFDILPTERLILRSPNLGDTATVFYMRTDAALNQYIKRTPPSTYKEVETFINDRLKDRKDGKAIYWVIANKELPGQYIGAISLWQFSEDRKTAEVGYDLHPDYHGKSIMSEALKAVLQFGKKELALDRIEAFTHEDNSASIRLLERNHFERTELKDPEVPTNVVYAIQTATI